MPDEGWSEFWRRFSEDLNVRTSSPVLSLDRSGPRPVIFAGGTSEEFDAVLSTVPMLANATQEPHSP